MAVTRKLEDILRHYHTRIHFEKPHFLIKEAHAAITAATCTDDLWLLSPSNIVRNAKRSKCIRAFDKGVYCHFVNKVAKLMNDGLITGEDWLGLLDDDCRKRGLWMLKPLSYRITKEVKAARSRYLLTVHKMA